MALLEELRSRARQSADRIFHAQMAIAEGCSFLYRIEEPTTKGEKRKHVLVTDPEEIKAYFDGDLDTRDGYYYVTTEKPNNEAIRDIWDRFVTGKPAQSVALTGPNGGAIPVLVKFVDAEA